MNYKHKYIKYKNKYLKDKNNQSGGTWPPEFDTVSFNSKISEIKSQARLKAYELLVKIDSLNNNRTNKLKIATAESLTGGLIFSTLVDIPFGGYCKYGCFGVYDTDAKRVFLGVTVKDVYTNKCVKQMAIGVLRNSNASIAIAVSGNAMPNKGNEERLGEVFFGIAGYNNEGQILVETHVFNMCNELSTCQLWINRPKNKIRLKKYLDKIKNTIENFQTDNANMENINNLKESIPSDELLKNLTDGYNDLQITSLVAEYIRYATVKKAYELCFNFINNNNLTVPSQ